ncbi:hypothetical protein [Parendozoicomonas haliclonae]|nr:hypothetical protein [Parendozoicomonas haliclonae]
MTGEVRVAISLERATRKQLYTELSPKAGEGTLAHSSRSRVKKVEDDETVHIQRARAELRNDVQALAPSPVRKALKSMGITVLSGVAKSIGIAGAGLAFVYTAPKVYALPFIHQKLSSLWMLNDAQFWGDFSGFFGFNMNMFMVATDFLVSIPKRLFVTPKRKMAEVEELQALDRKLDKSIEKSARELWKHQKGLQLGDMVQNAIDERQQIHLRGSRATENLVAYLNKTNTGTEGVFNMPSVTVNRKAGGSKAPIRSERPAYAREQADTCKEYVRKLKDELKAPEPPKTPLKQRVANALILTGLAAATLYISWPLCSAIGVWYLSQYTDHSQCEHLEFPDRVEVNCGDVNPHANAYRFKNLIHWGTAMGAAGLGLFMCYKYVNRWTTCLFNTNETQQHKNWLAQMRQHISAKDKLDTEMRVQAAVAEQGDELDHLEVKFR